MKALLAIPFGLALVGCSISVDHDTQSGDVKDVHISVGSPMVTNGNDHVISENRSIAAVKAIESTGPVDVEVTVGGAPGVTVTGDSNLLQYIRTTVQGEVLTIDMSQRFSSGHHLAVKVSTPTLDALRNTGSGDINVSGLTGGDFKLDSTSSGDTKLVGKVGTLIAHVVGSGDLDGESLAANNVLLDLLGSGSVNFENLAVDRFETHVKGSGDVKASGTAKQVTASVMGSGDVVLADLRAESADLEVMGSGDIEAFASKSVHARSMGSGDVTVHGNPQQRDISGKSVSVED
jgi:hypothetical protein